MPKQTFLNLSEEKRSAFINIAIKEFADNDYNTASISKIVETVGIAKGSVYQYFENKQDLFIYLIDVSNKVMLGFVTLSIPPKPDSDFFELLRWQMYATVQASLKYPIHSKLLRRAYSSPLPFRDTIFEKAKKIREEHFQTMITKAQSSKLLDSTLDAAVISFMVQGLMSELGTFLQSKFGKRKGDWIELPKVNEVFDQVIAILKNGLGK